MYCPKCKQKFEEGSRRFCPTDGSRLVSDVGGPSQRTGGVFANLIPKMDAISDLGIQKPDQRRSSIDTPIGKPPVSAMPVAAPFEVEDNEEMTRLLPMAAELSDSQLTRPAVRKVKPFEIPKGHVDLGDSYRTPSDSTEFDANDPDGFIGKNVKGRYKVVEFLGGDESGIAYLADDQIVEDKKVLVRIILDDDGSDEIMDSILAEERVSLSHFSHPNIARLIDSGQFTDGTDYLVTEYIDALSVEDILGIHGLIGELRAARVVRQAASALNEAHQEGILHRDLRPGNLIIDASSGEVEQTRVVNFGASSGEPNARNLGYKAPEVLSDHVPTISSDIFSLAAVAYEMLTGRLPFSGNTPKELLRSQSAGIDIRPSRLRPELPEAVDHILEKALSFNAADRYPKARDFGDAFYSALTELPQQVPAAKQVSPAKTENLVELVPAVAEAPKPKPIDEKPTAAAPVAEPAWKNRSPEPPQTGTSRTKRLVALGLLALLAFIVFAWYFAANRPVEPDVPAKSGQVPEGNINGTNPANSLPTEVPPLPRDIPQPPNTAFYENSKQNLKGDLLLNFVGFKMYYPKDWKVNGPKEKADANSRGKFIDISRVTDDDRMKEQMLVSYYPSKGTFDTDKDKFPSLVKETNGTLKKLLPDYKMLSEGETKVNGDWRAYEIKFQAVGKSPTGEKLYVWGRRLYIPAARLGVRNGFEITMLATSLSDEVRSADDVGVKGELAQVLYTFEPSQNF